MTLSHQSPVHSSFQVYMLRLKAGDDLTLRASEIRKRQIPADEPRNK